MSLLPSVATLSGTFPVIFLEARVHGNAHHFITQMGVSIDADQCSVGMLTRTSGVLLIAGFGSYCAYRIANKFLGNGFVWTIFDGTYCDLLSKSDTKLLYPIPGCSGDDERRTIISIDEFDDEDNDEKDLKENHQSTPSHMKRRALRIRGPDGNFIKLIDTPIWRFDKHSPKKGLAEIANTSTKREIKTRSEISEDDASSVGGSSSISIASRIRRIGRSDDKIRIEKEDIDNVDDDCMSIAPTEASEIRLCWDGDAIWDDEFAYQGQVNDNDDTPRADNLRGKSPTPSDISEMSAFKTLQSMFDSANNASTSGLLENDNDGSIFGDASDLAQMIHSKCMKNSNYMYHSVIVADLDGSDVVSVCSVKSTKSNMSVLKEKNKKGSHGLWELASRMSSEKPSTSSSFLDTPMSTSNPMTDSGISKSSGGSSFIQNQNLNSKKSTQMIDSAIDTGFASSDDDAGSIKSLSVVKPSKASGILSRTNLMDNIKEQPSPIRKRIEASSRASIRSLGSSSKTSDKSLEWFDD